MLVKSAILVFITATIEKLNNNETLITKTNSDDIIKSNLKKNDFKFNPKN
jgi:hypothetical protein